MKKDDVICPSRAGFRRIEVWSLAGAKGEYRCPVCRELLEIFDGSKAVAYRLTVIPIKVSTQFARAAAE